MPEKKYIENPEDIRLNEGQELQQILGNPPGWLLHWGNTFIAIGVTVFLILGWLVKYPDSIPTQVVLTTPQPPIRVFAEASGKLNEFRVTDNGKIKKGEIIAILDNPASLKDIDKLDAFLNEIQNTSSQLNIVDLEIPRDLKLGTLQNAYTSFSKSFDEYVFFLENNKFFSKVKNLEQQIRKLENLKTSLIGQRKTLQQVIDLSKKEWERNKNLKDLGDISFTQLEESEMAYLRSLRQMEALDNEVINTNLLVERTKMQILERKQDYKDGKSSGILSIQEDIQKIISDVENWKKVHIIQAPISGKVSLTKFRSAQQFINANEELLTIVPDDATQIIAKGILPSRGSGKVKPEMRANIRLAGYPYREFGILKCEVKSISLVPQGDGFAVELIVPQPLKTTYNKTIPFQQEMQGTANIITEDRRILERVFDQVLSIIRNE